MQGKRKHTDQGHAESGDIGGRYEPLDAIDPMGIFKSLTELHLLGDDLYLRLQAQNLGIVDYYITELEYRVLRELHEMERTPPLTHFVAAQSQMWIFAAYELLRTWRQRAREIIRWSEKKELEERLRALEGKRQSYMHFGREARIRQIRKVLENLGLVPQIKNQLLHLHVPFVRLEHIRVSIAKHEVRGKEKAAAMMPGYGRINSWCGSLDYDLENGRYSMGFINRRDIAESIRHLDLGQPPPSDDVLKQFDDYMSGKNVPDFDKADD